LLKLVHSRLYNFKLSTQRFQDIAQITKFKTYKQMSLGILKPRNYVAWLRSTI